MTVWSLDAWRYRLRREGSAGLVPVVVTEAAPSALIEVSCGGATVRLPTTVDAAWLAALVRGLGQSTC